MAEHNFRLVSGAVLYQFLVSFFGNEILFFIGRPTRNTSYVEDQDNVKCKDKTSTSTKLSCCIWKIQPLS